MYVLGIFEKNVYAQNSHQNGRQLILAACYIHFSQLCQQIY